MRNNFKILFFVLLIGGGFIYIISPFVVTNQIMKSILEKDVNKFSFFIEQEKLKENTKEVLMREMLKKAPSELEKSEASKYIMDKAIEAGLNKYLNPSFIINMLTNTMIKTDKNLIVNYEYKLLAPNTFIWDVKYEDSKNDFKVILKRHYLFLWKIEKLDFNI